MTAKRVVYFLLNFLFCYKTDTLASRFRAVFKPKIASGNDCKSSEGRQMPLSLCHHANLMPAVPGTQ